MSCRVSRAVPLHVMRCVYGIGMYLCACVCVCTSILVLGQQVAVCVNARTQMHTADSLTSNCT